MTNGRRRGGGGGRSDRRGGGSSGRQLSERVRTAKGRKTSSTRWLKRQLNDPYVAEARRRGYRSRAAFKLAQIDDKCRILKPGAQVVDLGAAPGGWSQVAVERCGPKGRVVGLDIAAIESLAGALFVEMDFFDEAAPARLRALLEGPADVVMSDMAAPATGHAATDHLRIVALAEAALDFAEQVLVPGGCFVAKVFQGGSEQGLLARLKRGFEKVRHVKPPASRKESAELYVVATGFRGGPPDDGS
ncbi:MAG: RlmE family RNA methyltransferase [Kiloniellales bacterium]|nr:RlmE family RNA methyltransferase [Kiloniellales bacterium]